ncbi:hypothetical protein FGO68_gene1112 [Halteria grandinella]|uniref:Uncharacterized protein n=1 Tax=Halteria grandinella TaxID=5974 RepID=A0A8J8NBV1_HALGN|nr:hypothetical protein FGO68_gene1112 [Halteria grandinella]
MIVFGGILDVCKELDDMIIYDLERRQWVRFFEELMLSPIRQKYGGLILNHDKDEEYTLTPPPQSPTAADSQPILKSSTSKFAATSPRLATSPDKPGDPLSTSRKTPSRRLLSPRSPAATSRSLAPPPKPTRQSTTATQHHAPPVRLESPTYISMKNSLIIKSGDANFESYYKSMIKRKMAQAMQSQMSSSNARLQDIASPRSGNVLFVRGKRPAARDGHSAVIINEQWFLVFGGDRHHMPFNDLFALDLEAEFSLKQGLFNK